MRAGDLVEVARFEQEDEARAVGVAFRAGGGAHIFQCSSGRMPELAFGEPAVCHRLTLDGDGLRNLMGMLGGERGVADALSRFFGRRREYTPRPAIRRLWTTGTRWPVADGA